MKYPIICGKCGNNQDYEPRVEIHSKTHTACKSCGATLYIYTQIQAHLNSHGLTNGDKTFRQIPKSNNKPPQTQESIFIDDPDELLISVAIRELNKSNPDPRWASILINCKKEKITIQGDAAEQFKNLPTQALVALLNKSLQEEY